MLWGILFNAHALPSLIVKDSCWSLAWTAASKTSTPSLTRKTHTRKYATTAALCCVLWWPRNWWRQIHYYSVSSETRYFSPPLPVAVRIPAMWYRPTQTLSSSFLLLLQGCNSIMAWNPWSKTHNFPRSDRVRRHRVQQLREHDISIKNGKLNFTLILTTHTYCTRCGSLSQFLSIILLHRSNASWEDEQHAMP